MDRMDRDAFFAATTPLDEASLRRVLWTLYSRGSAALRGRIEAELRAATGQSPPKPPPVVVDPEEVLSDVREFAELARAGAYLGGDRRVTPRERTRWRFTFRALAKDAIAASCDAALSEGVTALEELVDLAVETWGWDYFRSDDPLEAAGFVVSDAVETLWRSTREREGFAPFATKAAGQLVRWETRHGWTRSGYGKVAAKERPLAVVLAGMLPAPASWVAVVDCYLAALDQAARQGSGRARSANDRTPERRSEALALWHSLLLDRLLGSEAEDRLDRLGAHRALGGPEHWFFQARLAASKGDEDRARRLLSDALRRLPGRPEFRTFADELGLEPPELCPTCLAPDQS